MVGWNCKHTQGRNTAVRTSSGRTCKRAFKSNQRLLIHQVGATNLSTLYNQRRYLLQLQPVVDVPIGDEAGKDTGVFLLRQDTRDCCSLPVQRWAMCIRQCIAIVAVCVSRMTPLCTSIPTFALVVPRSRSRCASISLTRSFIHRGGSSGHEDRFDIFFLTVLRASSKFDEGIASHDPPVPETLSIPQVKANDFNGNVSRTHVSLRAARLVQPLGKLTCDVLEGN